MLRLMMLYWLKRIQAYGRRYWVHSILRRRLVYGECHHLLDEILSDTKKCLSYLIIKPETFQKTIKHLAHSACVADHRPPSPSPFTQRGRITAGLRKKVYSCSKMKFTVGPGVGDEVTCEPSNGNFEAALCSRY